MENTIKISSQGNFFEELEKQPKIYGILIVIIYGLLLGYAGMQVFESIKDKVPELQANASEMPASFFNIMKYVMFGSAFIGSFFYWAFLAGIFYLLALIFNKDTKFPPILFLSSYGYLIYIVTTIVSLYLTSKIDFTLYEDIQALQKATLQYKYIEYIGSLVFILYMTKVIEYVCKIKTWQAFVVACIPILFMMIFSIVSQSFSKI